MTEEIIIVGELEGAYRRDCLVFSKWGLSPCLRVGGSGVFILEEGDTNYHIRKLTPKECWQLMGYTDEDFEKAYNAGVSNSQLYKQAGNAIVKQVLMAIFSQLNIKGVKPWNEMTETEKCDIISKTSMGQ